MWKELSYCTSFIVTWVILLYASLLWLEWSYWTILLWLELFYCTSFIVSWVVLYAGLLNVLECTRTFHLEIEYRMNKRMKNMSGVKLSQVKNLSAPLLSQALASLATMSWISTCQSHCQKRVFQPEQMTEKHS